MAILKKKSIGIKVQKKEKERWRNTAELSDTPRNPHRLGLSGKLLDNAGSCVLNP